MRSNGEIKWRGELVFVGTVLRDELIAMVPTDGDRWHLYFAEVHLATWNDRTRKFAPPSPE